MGNQKAVLIVFTIAKEIERSFESPVILFTQNDYANNIFKSLVDLGTHLLEKNVPNIVADIVNTFHIEWLQAVQDLEQFTKRLKDLPRDTIFRAVDFTLESTQRRYKHFRKYIESLQVPMSAQERSLLQTNVAIIKDMNKIIHSAILEKQESLRYQADEAEFYDKIQYEIEELLNWLDNLYDHLAIQFCKIIDFQIPLEPADLTKTLKQIIEQVSQEPHAERQIIVKKVQDKSKQLSSVVRVSCNNDMEISKVVEKIKTIEDRMCRLDDQESSVVTALKHRTIYLEERLQSLENIKYSLNRLRAMSKTYTYEDSLYDDQAHIFNHLLPSRERCRLVEQLVKVWANSIGHVPRAESIISILSVSNLKEVFSDEIGNFTVDKHGRKIYKKEANSQLYQLNENRELVNVKDDDKHVYFYDECGRYYLDNTRQRIYKAYAKGSEYAMNREGNLLKLREERDDVIYSYDNLGRYYINDFGRRIYCTEDSESEYERDGFGNLIKIRELPKYKPCLEESTVTNETYYLKETVGEALKKCMAEVVLHQPEDPIAYLANSLENYSNNISAKQIRMLKRQEIIAERDLRILKKPAPEQSCTGEISIDYDFSQSYDTEPQNLDLRDG